MNASLHGAASWFVWASPLIAMALVLAVMPAFLPFLRKLKFGQTIYDLGPQAHKAKQGTPNMGGIVTGSATVLTLLAGAAVFAANGYPAFGLNSALWPLLFITVGCTMLFGFPDDYIKDVNKDHEGLKPKQKLIGQMVVGLLFSLYCYFTLGSDVWLPFTDKTWDLGILYIPIMTVLVMFITNSANLQDGVDGLLSSVTVVGMAAMGIVSTLLLRGGLGLLFQGKSMPDSWCSLITILCWALAGASVGFLFFNHHPAKIIMGDTGSMFIGGAFVGAAMLLKMQFLLIPICFTCIMSSVSVMMQTTYFKYTRKKYGQGRRIFKMSPLHHHFELSGMKENQIVLMYAAVELALCALAIWSVAAGLPV